MVSKALLAGLISSVTVVCCTWIGGFTAGIFTDVNAAIDAAMNGKGHQVERIISNEEIAQLEQIANTLKNSQP